jgi:hypothetical protein
MKKIVIAICSVLFLFSCLSAQYYKSITVGAGTRVIDYFPANVRYLYPKFTLGQVFLKNGAVSSNWLNYNLLLGEMEFINGPDTLAIVRKKDVNIITVERDTFLYRNGYLKLIHSGKVKVCLRDMIKLKDIVRKGAMGAPNRTSMVDSYSSMMLGGNFYDLIPTEDMVFQRTLEFYILTSTGELVDFRKKNVLHLYPEKEKEIQSYLKSNKVNFEYGVDILRFAGYLSGM